MGTQQMVLVILGVILIGIAITVGIGIFQAQNVSSNLDAIVNDLSHIAANAYQYRKRPAKLAGGGGDYSLYEIPPRLVPALNATYTIESQSETKLTILATSALDPENTVTATIDADGTIGEWIYTGDFQ
jgi:hypothetical protein